MGEGGSSVTPTLVTPCAPEYKDRARILGVGKSSNGGKLMLQVGIGLSGLENEREIEPE